MVNSNDLEIATNFVQEGDSAAARKILAQMINANPDDLGAWLLLSECVETDRQRQDCELQIQRISNKSAKERELENAAFDEVELLDTQQSPSKNKPLLVRRLAWLSIIVLLVSLVAAGVFFLRQSLPTWASSVIAEIQPEAENLPVVEPAQIDPAAPEVDVLAEIDGKSVTSNSSASTYLMHLPSLFTAPPSEETTPVEPAEPESIPDGRGNPNKWKSWPVVPYVSQNAIEIYLRGIENGANAHAFSLLGDCHSEPYIMFERFANSSYLEDPAYKNYRKTLKYFQDSWNRYFVTVVNGMTVASAFSPAWARSPVCKSGESPLDCEFRTNNPSILLISLGTNWGGRNPDEFEEYLRKIVEYAIKRDVLPVIATKGDPAGPNNPLNEAMVRVAYDYDIPLWNFWVAIQDLPYNGLNPWDGLRGVHLAPEAWPFKRDTGLMALDAIRRAISGE